MTSPLEILKSKCGVNNIIFSSMVGIDEADLFAMEQGRKPITADVLTALRHAGFLRESDFGEFNKQQNEFLESKIALEAYAGVHGKPVARLSEAERTQALTEAQNQPVSTYQEEDQYIIRYVKNDGSYY